MPPGNTLNLSMVAGAGAGVTAHVPLPAAFTLGTACSAVVDGTVIAPPVTFPSGFPGTLGLTGRLRFDAPPIVLSPGEERHSSTLSRALSADFFERV
jgi:hypothetical protein